MLKKILSIIQYVRWLLEKRHEVNQHGAMFRINEIKQNQVGEHVLLIQLVNQAITFICKPSLIVKDDSLLEGFSHHDVRAITFLATQEIYKPKYKIISQQFSDTFKRIIFKLRQRGCPHLLSKTADQISSEKTLLKQLDQEDAHRIGYVSAMEQVIREKEFLQRT